MNNLIFMVLLLTLFITHSHAFERGYFSDHEKGWHWYDDPPGKQEEEEEQNDPVIQMNAVRVAVSRARDAMVLHPDRENVKQYILMQNRLSGNAALLAGIWRDVLTENPELDFSLVHPTSNVARQVENDLLSSRENLAIRQLAKRSGLFFFYRSTCPYCTRFAPILRDFATTNGLTVIPVTTDGISLAEFPHSLPDRGQAAKFHVRAEPALFMVDPYTGTAVPVSYGLTSEADLRRRILDIAGQERGVPK